MGHAELVTAAELSKPCNVVYYFHKHVVRKETNSTTCSKVWVVFDASAKTAPGTSLSDHFFVGSTLHTTIIDV